MVLGYLIVGMTVGFLSAVVALISGSGLWTAFLIYASCGPLVMLLAVVMHVWLRHPDRSEIRVTAS